MMMMMVTTTDTKRRTAQTEEIGREERRGTTQKTTPPAPVVPMWWATLLFLFVCIPFRNWEGSDDDREGQYGTAQDISTKLKPKQYWSNALVPFRTAHDLE